MAAILLAALALTAPVPPDAAKPPGVEAKLHGDWEGGPCQGTFTFRPDGTYQLRGWSPGNCTLGGTWAFRWDALPPTLVLTCKSSSDKEYVGKVWEAKVAGLNADALTIAWDSATEGKAASRYERVKPGEK